VPFPPFSLDSAPEARNANDCGFWQPFDSTTPFVEKDGYAWCVGCHTNRYSTKCKKCRKPVTDTVVKALGAEWHAQCFCCMVRFPRSWC
jgi:hypothetical protein